MSFKVVSINGQRIFCPEPHVPEPPRGSEVIVRNIPGNVFEDKLMALFSKAGNVYKIRIMMDYSGATRKFGFIRFLSVMEAYKAVELYDDWPIQHTPKLQRLRVEISIDNRRLYIANIPRNVFQADILEELQKMDLPTVKNVIVYSSFKNPAINRGFAFIEFENNTAATIARKRFKGQHLFGYYKVFVEWAKPEPILTPLEMAQATNLFMRNLHPLLSDQGLWDAIKGSLSKTDVISFYKRNHFAFIKFDSCFAASAALQIMEKVVADLPSNGSPVEITFACPLESQVSWNKQHPCYKSVPVKSSSKK